MQYLVEITCNFPATLQLFQNCTFIHVITYSYSIFQLKHLHHFMLDFLYLILKNYYLSDISDKTQGNSEPVLHSNTYIPTYRTIEKNYQFYVASLSLLHLSLSFLCLFVIIFECSSFSLCKYFSSYLQMQSCFV